uniref:C-type lectin domain-containing protein n=1 Tax=Pundamilia nyererei TaxID=303518 RepID=A0A3B4FW91_9CICH
MRRRCPQISSVVWCTLRGPIYPTIHSAAVGVDHFAAKYSRRERPKSELSKVSTEYDVIYLCLIMKNIKTLLLATCRQNGSFYKCEEGWEKHGGKCYYFSIRQSSWKQSRVECRAKGGDLVKIGKLMKEGEDKFWIGLTDSAVERRWLWVDGSLLKFWAGKEPNNVTEGDCDGEDCVRMGEEFENKDLKCCICEKAGVTAT